MAIKVSVLWHYHPPSSEQLLEIYLNSSLTHLSTKLVSCLNTSLPLTSTMQVYDCVEKELRYPSSELLLHFSKSSEAYITKENM